MFLNSQIQQFSCIKSKVLTVIHEGSNIQKCFMPDKKLTINILGSYRNSLLMMLKELVVIFHNLQA